MYDQFIGNESGVQYAKPKETPPKRDPIPSQIQFNKSPSETAKNRPQEPRVNPSGRAVHEISPMQASASFWRWFTRQSIATEIDSFMLGFMRDSGIDPSSPDSYDSAKEIYINKYRSII